MARHVARAVAWALVALGAIWFAIGHLFSGYIERYYIPELALTLKGQCAFLFWWEVAPILLALSGCILALVAFRAARKGRK